MAEDHFNRINFLTAHQSECKMSTELRSSAENNLLNAYTTRVCLTIRYD